VPELSRRARGFATWAVIKHLGREGIAEMVERNCAAASMIADTVAGLEDVAILNDIVLNQVVVRFGASLPIEDGDRLTERTIFHLQEDGEAFAGGAKWRGRLVMRISVTNYQTDEREAERTIAAIDRAYGRARSGG
jgi:glutamate/tyrosine decarboxylase-like PLP-dependent enzyme